MKIAILHQELEWAEQQIDAQLKLRHAKTYLCDIRETDANSLLKYDLDLVLNRVYASVANRDYNDNLKTLDILDNLEAHGIRCINSFKTSFYDYSKYDSSLVMNNSGVATPETFFIGYDYVVNKHHFYEFCEIHGFPLIIKRNAGGRAKDVFKIDNQQSLLEVIKQIFSVEKLKSYRGGFIAQKFCKPTKSHDARIAIYSGKLEFAYGRTLTKTEGDDNWLASCANGSEVVEYKPTIAEINLAIQATESIGALFNEVDMAFTKEGPMIIENNPTPNYMKSIKDDHENIINVADLLIGQLH